MLVLEPSLFAVRRGQEWIQRGVDRGVRTLAVSETATREFEYSSSGVLTAFRSQGFWSRYAREVSPTLIADLVRLNRPLSPGYWTAGDPDEPAIRIVYETLGGMDADGSVLASRRFEFFSVAVAAGVEVLLKGRDGFESALDAVRVDVGDDLADALARRVRYLAWLTHVDGRPRLLVYDAGLHASR